MCCGKWGKWTNAVIGGGSVCYSYGSDWLQMGNRNFDVPGPKFSLATG